MKPWRDDDAYDGFSWEILKHISLNWKFDKIEINFRNGESIISRHKQHIVGGCPQVKRVKDDWRIEFSAK